MKDRENYSSSFNMSTEDEEIINIAKRRNSVIIGLKCWDLDDAQERAHLKSLIEQIEPIIDTPFKS